eukprot:TRINITY_DN20675_c0_g1_i1.p2 TRINITY_DN20675_c0_g1~~TRINITY_DN20675_c0_g1_i1.p2  ORF type:complete len:170 (-),score=6.55 TRINITY_DN20675_c0_g1_i1:175-645(-)
MRDPHRFVDFSAASGGTATHTLTTLSSDTGTPATLREVNGHPVHACGLVRPLLHGAPRRRPPRRRGGPGRAMRAVVGVRRDARRARVPAQTARRRSRRKRGPKRLPRARSVARRGRALPRRGVRVCGRSVSRMHWLLFSRATGVAGGGASRLDAPR